MIIRKSALKCFDFAGLSIYDYTAGADLGSSLAAIDVPPGASHAKAWSRKSDKYYLVIHGRVRFTVDEKVADLGMGDFCFIRPGTAFSYENVSGEPAGLVLVHTPTFDLSAEVLVD